MFEGFTKHGSPSSASTRSANAAGVVRVAQREVPRVRQPGGRERPLHHDLVHADRGAQHARADVRQTRRARAGPAPCRPRRTDRAATGTPRRPRAAGPTSSRTSSARAGSDGQLDRRARRRERGRQRVARAFQLRDRFVGQQPAAVGRDRDGHDFVLRRDRARARPRPRSPATRRARPTARRTATARAGARLTSPPPAAPRGCRAP